MSLAELASRISASGQVLTGASARLAGLVPPPAAFGAGAPGHLGALGRALHAQVMAALAARSREAAAHGARLGDAAEMLRWAGAGYAEAEEAAQRRHARAPEGGP
ncbi:MAG TPA: hypothetical protein VFB84_01115 [Micromonosporaceae bacterium]|nr:hypothetical protein [Micromonosporaceae bacterium]